MISEAEERAVRGLLWDIIDSDCSKPEEVETVKEDLTELVEQLGDLKIEELEEDSEEEDPEEDIAHGPLDGITMEEFAERWHRLMKTIRFDYEAEKVNIKMNPSLTWFQKLILIRQISKLQKKQEERD